MNDRGIYLIACGHPYYGRMAYNLAISLKAADRKIQICLGYAGDALNHLSKQEREVFDYSHEIDSSIYKGGEQKWIRCKVFLDLLTPFDETLFIDADVIWIGRNSPVKVMQDLSIYDFTVANHEAFDLDSIEPDLKIWANVQETRDTFGLTGKYLSLHSEFMYFKKTDKVLSMFSKAREVFDDPKVKSLLKFANAIPDEFAFAVAINVTGLAPHKTPYHPTFWVQMQGRTSYRDILDNYLAVSIGGTYQPTWTKDLYNRIGRVSFNKVGRKFLFRARDKRRYLTERQKI